MNFKVRAKNLSFWISVAIAVVVPVLGYFGITGADLTTWPECPKRSKKVEEKVIK